MPSPHVPGGQSLGNNMENDTEDHLRPLLGGHQAAVVPCAGAEGASVSWMWGWGHTEPSSRDLPGVEVLKRRKTSDNPELGAVRPDRPSNPPGSSSAESNPYFSNSSDGEE